MWNYLTTTKTSTIIWKTTFLWLITPWLIGVKSSMNFLNVCQYFTCPPYSPSLNPIEEFFAELKRLFRERTCKSLKEVLINIFHVFENVRYSLLPKIFNHSLTLYLACIQKNLCVNINARSLHSYLKCYFSVAGIKFI